MATIPRSVLRALSEPPTLRVAGGGIAPDPHELSRSRVAHTPRYSGLRRARGAPSHRGGDHHRIGERCHSPLASALTMPLPTKSLAAVYSRLRRLPAADLDVVSMMRWPAAHGSETHAVREEGSIGAKDSAHLCSAQSQLTTWRQSTQQRRAYEPATAQYQWTAARCCWPAPDSVVIIVTCSRVFERVEARTDIGSFV